MKKLLPAKVAAERLEDMIDLYPEILDDPVLFHANIRWALGYEEDDTPDPAS
jgi:hypothetical protein